MWPIMLEKAFAKAYGSYGALEGGFTCTGFMNMSANPDKMYHQQIRNLELLRKPDVLWEKLKKLFESGHIMGISFSEVSKEKTGKSETKAANGLIAGHAYGLMQVMEVEGKRFVKCRNPWGQDGEWKGDWSDNSPKWKEFAVINEAIDNKPGNDGIFVMCIEDLAANIEALDTCRCFKEGYSVDLNPVGDDEEEEEEEYEYEDEEEECAEGEEEDQPSPETVKQIKAQFKKADKNGDGILSKQELIQLMKTLNPDMSNRELNELMNQVDTSGDGKIQVEEFINWCFQMGTEEGQEEHEEDFE